MEEKQVAVQKPIPVQKYAGVRFKGKAGHYDNDTEYTFKHDIDSLYLGDTVVCDCTTGLAVGTVVRTIGAETTGNGKSTRWLVQKLDMEKHELRMEREAKRRDIRQQMDARRKQLEDEALYRMMAERDPEMAKLIEEYYTE